MKRTHALVLATALGATTGSLLSSRSPAVAHASPIVLSDGNAIADVAEKVTPSVVNISTTTVMQDDASPFGFDPFFGGGGRERLGKSLGSGVVISDKGLIVTNNHVIANARDIKVQVADGTEYDAKLVGADPKSDVAVLKLEGKPRGLVALKFGDSSKLRLGDVVLAVGNPLGLGQTVTMGIVSAKGRANMGIEDYEDFIQTDAAINPGNSGGALVNLKGELVGINTAVMSSARGFQGIGFAIPSDMVESITKMLVDQGKVTRGWLGVSIQDVDRELAETLELGTQRGVLLTQVMPDSPAAKAGLARGDVVVAVGGKPTHKSGNLRNAVAQSGVGKAVTVEYYRGKAKKSAQVTLTEAPAEQKVVARGGGDDGVAVKGKLGIKVVPVGPAARKKYALPDQLDRGVVVTDVTAGSQAAELGLQPGDVILEVNRTAVSSGKELEAVFKAAGRRLALLVYRDGATVYLMIQK